MSSNLIEKLIKTFGLLSKASARKTVYSQKARQEENQEVSHLLRTISKSEAIQARRLFNSLRGKIDTSNQYISTIFEKELKDVVDEYSESLSQAQKEDNKAMTQALSQLRAAERRIMSFYSKEKKKVNVHKAQKYFVCQFCGYINTKKPPESCPICGANQNGFSEVL